MRPQGLTIDHLHLPATPGDVDTQIRQVIEWLRSVRVTWIRGHTTGERLCRKSNTALGGRGANGETHSVPCHTVDKTVKGQKVAGVNR